MYKPILICLAALWLVVGCASTEEPTAIPVNPTAIPANPPAQGVNQQSAPTSAPGALPSPSNCQSKVMGRVVDAKGNMVKGATVDTKSGKFTARTVTDDNGLYGFAGLCGGTFTFTVTPKGQKAQAIAGTLALDGQNIAKKDLALK